MNYLHSTNNALPRMNEMNSHSFKVEPVHGKIVYLSAAKPEII